MTAPRCFRCQEPVSSDTALADATSTRHTDPEQCIEALRARIMALETANAALRIEERAAREEARELGIRNERLRETIVGLQLPRHPRSRLRSLRLSEDDLEEGGDAPEPPPTAT